MIEVTFTVKERPDRTSVKWEDKWRGTVWDFEGTIVVVLGPGRQDWQALCFIIDDTTGLHLREDEDNPDEWACSWFTTNGVRMF
jgi:hypothetical protein